MKWQQLILLLSVVYMNCQGNVDYELTYPERLSENRVKRDLSTATENGHENTATFAINAFQKKWVLDAKQNHHLMPKAFTVKTFDSDDNEVISRKAPEPCHYQGSIRGIPDSVVVLDTCSGLRGLIDDGTQSYQIEPHDDFQETGAHRISKDEIEFDADEHCGTEFDESSPKAAGPKSSKLAKTLKRLRRGLGHVVDTEDIYRSYLTTNETKYTEVVFVVDNGVYLRFNKTKPVIDKVLILCNAVDAVYQRINIRIVAIAIEIWTNGDRMPRGKDLKNFAVYRRNKIKIPNDNAQFLSHHGWGRAIGIAYLWGMCSAKISCGINKFNTKSLLGPLVTVAHEMGHNFGFGHNKPPCKCLTPKGCFMYGGQGRTNLPGFSDCNLNKIKMKKHSCLFNVPTYNMNARCGNGIKENDEECDCGTPEMCKQKDPCCQPHDCRLKPSSQCSDLHHTCCQDCQFKKQGSICRKVKTDCDVPEHCPGDSGDCPDDATLKDGTPCNSNSYCYSGNCAETRERQCQDLWGSGTKDAAQGCYDKLNTEAKGYGTCDPGSNSSCAAEDVLCGQIQCSSSRKTPKVKYGKSYKTITLADSSKCSAAVLKTTDDALGQGMVQDGTRCGHEKVFISDS